jgi:hypothetical protein
LQHIIEIDDANQLIPKLTCYWFLLWKMLIQNDPLVKYFPLQTNESVLDTKTVEKPEKLK